MRFKDRLKLQKAVSLAAMPQGGPLAFEPPEQIHARATAVRDGFVRGLAERIEGSPHDRSAMLEAHAKRQRKARRAEEQQAARELREERFLEAEREARTNEAR